MFLWVLTPFLAGFYLQLLRKYQVCPVVTVPSTNDNRNTPIATWKPGSITKSRQLLWVCGDPFSWYLQQLVVLWKPDFCCCSSFLSFWLDYVTTCPCIFGLNITNVTTTVVLSVTQVGDHVNKILISQLVSSISRTLQKSLKYFKSTVISTFLVPPALILLVNLKLDLDSWYPIISFGPSIQYFQKRCYWEANFLF